MAQATSQGTLLKSTREARGISLEVVHEVTKIPMDVLRAIEEGYTVRSLSPFYLKGFIKMYAEYLKINVQDLYADYKKPQAPVVAVSVVKAKAPVLPEESFDLKQWLGKVFTYRRKQQIAALTVLFVAFFLLFKLITFFTHRPARPEVAKPGVKSEPVKVKKEKPVATKNNPVVETAAVKKIPPPSPAKVPEPALPKNTEPAPVKTSAKAVSSYASTATTIPQASAPTQQLGQEIMLTVRAKKDTWLRVESDGITVFQSGLTRGKSETWLASNKIEISGKNIQQLEFELNGKMIGALSRRDSKAKKIMITREGLAVVP